MYCKPLFFRQYLANFKSVIFGKFHTITIESWLTVHGFKDLLFQCIYFDSKLQVHVHVCSLHICYMFKEYHIQCLWNIIACINSLARFFLLLAFNLMIHCTCIYEYHIGKTYCLHISYLYRLGKHPIA